MYGITSTIQSANSAPNQSDLCGKAKKIALLFDTTIVVFTVLVTCRVIAKDSFTKKTMKILHASTLSIIGIDLLAYYNSTKANESPPEEPSEENHAGEVEVPPAIDQEEQERLRRAQEAVERERQDREQEAARAQQEREARKADKPWKELKKEAADQSKLAYSRIVPLIRENLPAEYRSAFDTLRRNEAEFFELGLERGDGNAAPSEAHRTRILQKAREDGYRIAYFRLYHSITGYIAEHDHLKLGGDRESGRYGTIYQAVVAHCRAHHEEAQQGFAVEQRAQFNLEEQLETAEFCQAMIDKICLEAEQHIFATNVTYLLAPVGDRRRRSIAQFYFDLSFQNISKVFLANNLVTATDFSEEMQNSLWQACKTHLQLEGFAPNDNQLLLNQQREDILAFARTAAYKQLFQVVGSAHKKTLQEQQANQAQGEVAGPGAVFAPLEDRIFEELLAHAIGKTTETCRISHQQTHGEVRENRSRIKIDFAPSDYYYRAPFVKECADFISGRAKQEAERQVREAAPIQN